MLTFVILNTNRRDLVRQQISRANSYNIRKLVKQEVRKASNPHLRAR